MQWERMPLGNNGLGHVGDHHMSLWVKSVLIMSVLMGVGCATTAGPFVTNISSDGAAGLIIEKCMTKYGPWMATVSNASCTSTRIKVRKEGTGSPSGGVTTCA